MLLLPGAPDVVKVEGLALGPDGPGLAAMLDGKAAAFNDVALVAAGLVLLPDLYGALFTGITGRVTTFTRTDADSAPLGTGDDMAAETGHTVL